MQQNGLLLDGSGVAGNINNLTINLTSATASNNTIEFSPSLVLDNTLTITAGVFQPYASTFSLRWVDIFLVMEHLMLMIQPLL
ncbi:MAG: hypothetical protein CM15mV52_0790 [uncultured marine virus]|nr:MAG: hypothetical protein CM15mV52_0790 [uncultured marine virus]